MEVVYFQFHDKLEDFYVGYSTVVDSRAKYHRSVGRRLVAIIPGTKQDESTLHKDLAEHRVKNSGNESTYQGEAIANYVCWLLMNHYAVASPDKLDSLGAVPYSVWAPRQVGQTFYDIRTGQYSLGVGAKSPPATRISWASKFAELTSLSDDWYTPPHVIELARAAMGGIDTDPASCAEANTWINARHWYSREMDGLDPRLPWSGRIWLNPPYGRGDSSAAAFLERLLAELKAGNVSCAITCLSLNSASALWFQPVWDAATLHAVWKNRIRFIGEGSSPSKGTILSFFGQGKFADTFREHANIVMQINKGAK